MRDFLLKGGALEQARGLEQAGKRPNGRSCRDETWIVYQGFNDCRLCTTQWKTTKIETEILGKNVLEVFLTISCSITLRGRNVTQASSRIVFKRRICEWAKQKNGLLENCILDQVPKFSLKNLMLTLPCEVVKCATSNVEPGAG